MTGDTTQDRRARVSRALRAVPASPGPSGPDDDPGRGTRQRGQVRPSVPAVLAALVGGVLLGMVLGSLVPVGRADGGVSGSVDPAAASTPDGPAVPAELRDRVLQLQAEGAARDAEALTALLSQAESALKLLEPVIEFAGAHGPGAPVPSPTEIEGWRGAVAQASAVFGEPPSAGTDINVARAGLESALTDFETMVNAFDLADEVEDPARALALAASARRSAASSWSVGATQLDAVAVKAGRGHVHLFLPVVEGSGALTPDPHEDQHGG